MSQGFARLEVYETGEVTVVGFGGREVLDQVNIAACRQQIAELVQQNNAKTLAFDLTGVRLIPSGLLGLLASLKNLGIGIQLFNPSEDVRDVLETTKLNQLFEIHEIKP